MNFSIVPTGSSRRTAILFTGRGRRRSVGNAIFVP